MRFLGLDYPKLFFFSPQLLCPPKKTPPNFMFGILFDFSLFSTVCSQSSSVIKTEGIFFAGIVLCFCLFRLSNTLSELWVSNSHTS